MTNLPHSGSLMLGVVFLLHVEFFLIWAGYLMGVALPSSSEFKIILDKLHKKSNNWCNWLLTMAEYLTLLKYKMRVTPVYSFMIMKYSQHSFPRLEAFWGTAFIGLLLQGSSEASTGGMVHYLLALSIWWFRHCRLLSNCKFAQTFSNLQKILLVVGRPNGYPISMVEIILHYSFHRGPPCHHLRHWTPP